METRITFVDRLGERVDGAWLELDRVYRPMIFNWLVRYKVQDCDAEDIAQEVMAVVARRIGDFHHNGRVGAFRKWLRTITAHTGRKHLDKLNRQPTATGDSVFQEMLEQLESDASDISRDFNLQHDRFVLQDLLRQVSKQFQASTLEAFRLHAIEGLSASEVAEHLGVTPQVVYVAKARVLHGLRALAGDLIDEVSQTPGDR